MVTLFVVFLLILRFLGAKGCGCMRPGLSVPLNIDTLAKFFAVGGRYVYVVSGLRTTTSPCGKVQWRKGNQTLCKHE